MSTERTRELHSPTAELVPPLRSSLPCTVMRTGIEGCWDRPWLSQPAAGNVSCSCRAGEGCLPGQLQLCSLQHSCRRRCCSLPGAGSGLWHGHSWAACTHRACMLEQTKGSTAPVASFQPALCPPSLQTPSLCFVYCGRQVRHTHASCLCLARFVPQTSERSSDIQSFIFTVPKSFSYPQAAVPPNKSFSIAYSSQVLWEWAVTSRPTSSGFTCQVYPQAIWQISSARWTRETETTSMNLQTQKRCHNCQCSAAHRHAPYNPVFLSSQLADF